MGWRKKGWERVFSRLHSGPLFSLHACPRACMHSCTHTRTYTHTHTQAEQAELKAVRERWAAMQDLTDRSQAHVDQQVQIWAEQRARLEEEILRRQEASRFAAPSIRAAMGTTGMGDGYVSAYAGVTVHAVDAVGAANGDVQFAPEAIRAVPGLMPPTTTTAICNSVKEAAQVCAACVLCVCARVVCGGG